MRWFKFPRDIIFAFVTAIRFVPVLMLDTIMIMDAQKSRGLELEKGNLIKIIEEYKPSIMAIEDIFYSKNVKSTLLLGHARASALLAGATSDLLIFEYSARKVKQSVSGNGNAHKKQVQYMVRVRLKMDSDPKPIDASDALAIALCHYQQTNLLG